MFPVQLIAKIFKILRSGDSPNQIAFGFAIGMIIGLTPFFTFHNIILIILVIILNINLGTVIFSFALFSGLAWIFDPLFHNLGFFLLVDVSSLKPLWTALYNFPVIALSHYNNTVVMGSFIAALILFIPAFFFAKYFVFYYREHLDARFQKLKIVQLFKGSKVYAAYEKIADWRQ